MDNLNTHFLYPAAIFDVLDNIEYIDHYFVEVKTDDNGNDDIDIIVQKSNKESLNENVFKKELKDRFRAKLRVAPNVKTMTEKEILKICAPEIKRKPVKFIDKRNITNHE